MSIFNKHAHQERPYIVIVDIDGTISEATEDRLHLLPPPGKGALTNAYFHERRSLNNFHRDRVITFEQIAE